MQRLVFITVTDGYFFPGTLATIHSIRAFHPKARVLVVHNHIHKRPLLAAQRQVLESAGACVVDAAQLAKPGRKLAAWELKAYAASDLTGDDDVLVGIDSDCILCGPIDDLIASAKKSGRFHGGKDGGGPIYDQSYDVYGIQTPVHNHSYISASLYVCALTDGNRRILQKWADACDKAIFGGGKIYPGHGDQGVLNAVIWAERPGGKGVQPLDNRIWSQHHCYWQAPVSVRAGRLFNDRANIYQRSIHCGGGEKFWTLKHRERVEREGLQASCYAWFLTMLWFGLARVGPEHLLPDQVHLVESLIRFRWEVTDFFPAIREMRRLTPGNAFGELATAPDPSGKHRSQNGHSPESAGRPTTLPASKQPA